jgi:hypothetical protein
VYPTFEDIAGHLNKSNHKISFLASRDDVGSTKYPRDILVEDVNKPREEWKPPTEWNHSFGVPRFFFRLNLTSAMSNLPYAYVNWAMFALDACHRTSFEGQMTRNEWTTGPIERENINPFCYLEDILPSRFALGAFLCCIIFLVVYHSLS